MKKCFRRGGRGGGGEGGEGGGGGGGIELPQVKLKKMGVVSPSTFTEQINNDVYYYYYYYYYHYYYSG